MSEEDKSDPEFYTLTTMKSKRITAYSLFLESEKSHTKKWQNLTEEEKKPFIEQFITRKKQIDEYYESIGRTRPESKTNFSDSPTRDPNDSQSEKCKKEFDPFEELVIDTKIFDEILLREEQQIIQANGIIHLNENAGTFSGVRCDLSFWTQCADFISKYPDAKFRSMGIGINDPFIGMQVVLNHKNAHETAPMFFGSNCYSIEALIPGLFAKGFKFETTYDYNSGYIWMKNDSYITPFLKFMQSHLNSFLVLIADQSIDLFNISKIQWDDITKEDGTKIQSLILNGAQVDYKIALRKGTIDCLKHLIKEFPILSEINFIKEIINGSVDKTLNIDESQIQKILNLLPKGENELKFLEMIPSKRELISNALKKGSTLLHALLQMFRGTLDVNLYAILPGILGIKLTFYQFQKKIEMPKCPLL